MFKSMERNKLGVRILLGAVVALLAGSMLLYLVPGLGSNTNIANTDVVADVSGQSVTVAEVQKQLQNVMSSGQVPPSLVPYYAQQIIQQLVSEKLIGIEAQRLGITVAEPEVVDRIKLIIPGAYENGVFVGDEKYAQMVLQNTRMGVEEFEEKVHELLVQEKVQDLVTSSVAVMPDEVHAEFLRKNEKIKVDYATIHPDSLESQVQVNDADLNAFYEKNKTRYMVPEQRVVQYILIDPSALLAKVNIPESELQAYYNGHISLYKVDDRSQIAQIFFKTVGKTDAEIAEIRKKADDVLKQAKHGAKFEDLAKKNSDATDKDTAGSATWIVRGQAMPELEKAAFSVPKGEVSDLIQTQIGIYIIKVLDRETAHTKSLAEVLPTIQMGLAAEKSQAMADDLAQKIGEQIRQTAKPSLDALAKQFGLTTDVTAPMGVQDSAPELGVSPDLHETIFRLRAGDVSQPIRTDRGYVIVSLKSIHQGHQGTLAEMHDKVVTDYRHDTAIGLARQRAADFVKRAQGGEDFAKVAKALGLEMKTSELISRDGSIPGAGTAKQIQGAFNLSAGKTGDPVFLGSDWLVFRVVDHQMPNPADFDKQKKDIEDGLLNSKRQLAFESFRTALESEMRKAGKLTYNSDALKQLISGSSS